MSRLSRVAAANLKHDSSAGKSGPALRDLYTRGVAQLTYELLGGAPGSPVYGQDRHVKYGSLPALNEEANSVLQSALSMRAAYASGRDFYETMARAAGLDPMNLPLTGGVGLNARGPAAIPSARKTLPVNAMPLVVNLQPADSAVVGGLGVAPTLRAKAPRTHGDTTARPVATFDGRGAAIRSDPDIWAAGDDEPSGNVWDRLALVSGEGGSRLWVGGVALAFLILVAGSLGFLRALEHPAARKPLPRVASTPAAEGGQSARPAWSCPAVARPGNPLCSGGQDRGSSHPHRDSQTYDFDYTG